MGTYKFTNVYNPNGKNKRQLVMGGPLTIAPPTEKGFAGGFGFMATEKEKDYVHRLKRYIDKCVPDGSVYITSSQFWEENHFSEIDWKKQYADAADFNADVILLQLGDYLPKDKYNKENFLKSISMLIDFLSAKKSAHIVLICPYISGHIKDDIQFFAHEKHYSCIYLGGFLPSPELEKEDLHRKEPEKLYPKDEGHQLIASAILCIVEKFLRR
jgi:hypothetical protein